MADEKENKNVEQPAANENKNAPDNNSSNNAEQGANDALMNQVAQQQEDYSKVMNAVSEMMAELKGVKLTVNSFMENGGIITEGAPIDDETKPLVDYTDYDNDIVEIDDNVIKSIDNIVFD